MIERIRFPLAVVASPMKPGTKLRRTSEDSAMRQFFSLSLYALRIVPTLSGMKEPCVKIQKKLLKS